MSVLAHLLPTGPTSLRDFFRYVFSDLRPMGGVCYPAGVAIVDACAGGGMLGSEENWNAPKNTCHPGFVENCDISKFLLREERSEIRELRICYSSTRGMYSSSSCDGATHVLSTLLRTVCPTYSVYSSTAAAGRRATYRYTYVCGLLQQQNARYVQQQ